MPDEVTDTLQRWPPALPGGGESRPGQVEMATSVAAAMAGGRNLVVQAGTGTGKSLAYLVPAALSGEKVVVATATKALQDQLADKDLPLVAGATDGGLSFAVLKGRSNYVCRQRVSEIGGRRQPALARPGVGRPARRRRHPHRGGRRRHLGSGHHRRPGAQPRPVGRGHRRPATGPSSRSSPTSGPGPWCRPRPGSARGRSGARPGGTASPRTPGPGPPRPTSSW